MSVAQLITPPDWQLLSDSQLKNFVAAEFGTDRKIIAAAKPKSSSNDFAVLEYRPIGYVDTAGQTAVNANAVASQIQEDGVYAFRGKLDEREGSSAFLVDSLENPGELKVHSIKEVHIEIEQTIKDEKDILHLKNFLFDITGNCSVYFHIDTINKQRKVLFV